MFFSIPQKVKFKFNKFLKFVIGFLVYTAVITIICILCDVYYFDPKEMGIQEKYSLYIRGVMVLSILIAYRQIKSSNDFARRQLSVKESLVVLKEIRDYRAKLQKFKQMDFHQAMHEKDPIPYKTIHEWILKKDGANYVGEPGKYELSEDGKKIKAYLRAIINSLEYIAIGVMNSTFDETIMKDSMGTIVKRIYDSLSAYIEHVRISEDAPKFAENLEWLATERWNNKKEKKNTRD